MRGFTLLEVLIAITIIGIMGFIITDLLSKGFRGSSKTQVIGNIKQNGQLVLNIIEQSVRNADVVVCPDTADGIVNLDTMVLRDKTSGKFIRFKIIPGNANSNGALRQDSPTVSDPNLAEGLCTDGAIPQTIITDTDSLTGVFVKEGQFTRDKTSGFKDLVTVRFVLGSPIAAPKNFESQFSDEEFKTSIQIR